MSEEPDAYQTYLLRLWRVQIQGRWQLRASLESPRTGQRRWFADLVQLQAFLAELRDAPGPEEMPGAWEAG